MQLDFSPKLTEKDNVYTVDISVPAKEVTNLRDKMYAEMAKVAELPGFRAGKVPVEVIKQKYARQVNEELSQDLTAHLAVLSAKQLQISAGFRPRIAPASLPNGTRSWIGKFNLSGDFLVTLVSAVPPPVTVNTDFEIHIEPPNISEDVDEQIHHLRHDLVVRTAKTEPATKSDEVVCSIKVTDELTGLEEVPLRVERFPFSFDLKSHSMMSDALAERLEGVVAGQDLVFSEGDYRFDIHIDAVHSKVLPELTDEFAVSVGFENIADLRHNIEQEWVAKNAMRFKNAAHGTVRKALLAANPFEIPADWIEVNFQALRKRLGNLAEQLGMSEGSMRAEAETFAATDYLLELINEQHRNETDLTESDINNYAAEEVSNPAHTPEDFLAGVIGNGQYQYWLESVKKKKALDWLLVKNNKKVQD
jgi:trigger factor